jgi:hypothetical protein
LSSGGGVEMRTRAGLQLGAIIMNESRKAGALRSAKENEKNV